MSEEQQPTQPAPAQPAMAQPVAQESPSTDDSYVANLAKQLETAKTKLAEIESANAEAEKKKALEQGEYKKLLDTEQAKYQAELKARDEQIRGLQIAMANEKRDSAVKEIVGELFMDKHKIAGDAIVSKRIGATVDDKGQHKLIIYDEKGNKTKGDLESFKKDLMANTHLVDYLKGDKVGSGGNVQEPQKPIRSPQPPTAMGQNMIDPLQKFRSVQAYKDASPSQLVEMAKTRNRR